MGPQDQRCLYYSPRWLELIGYLPGELPGHIDTFTERLHRDDRAAVEQGIAEYRSGARSEYRVEFRLRHKDGSWRSILTRGIVLRERAGVPSASPARIPISPTGSARPSVLKTTACSAPPICGRHAIAPNWLMLQRRSFSQLRVYDIRQPLQAMALLLGGLKGDVTTNEGATKITGNRALPRIRDGIVGRAARVQQTRCRSAATAADHNRYWRLA